MSLDRSGCLHVIARVKVLSERADRRLDIAMCQGRFGLTRAYRRRADAEIGEAQILETLAISPRAGGKSHHGVVAVAARELGEADAGGAVRHRNTDGREHIAPGERGLEQAFEELVGFDRALPLRAGDFDLGAKRDHARRQLGRRIGEGERAADCAAVADRGVTDVRKRQSDERRRLRNLGGAFRLRVAHQRADFDMRVSQRDAVEPADAVDVDQQRRLAQPHVERRDQALSACEQPRIVACQQFDRVGDRASLGVCKRCRLQPVLPATLSSLLSPVDRSRQSSSAAFRLVKHALPRPVPIVSTPQGVASRMNGTSLKPCTTASLCRRVTVSCSPMVGIASCKAIGRLKLLLSQLPGKFCAPRSMVPSSAMIPGQPMPMKGARRNPSLPARAITLSSISISFFTAPSRVTSSSSAYRQSWSFHTSALDRSLAFFKFSATTPARILVPPMSTARIASCASNIHRGPKCAAPINPASLGSLRMGRRSTCTLSALRMTAARPMMSSPTRLSRKPPPTTILSVSRPDLSLRKRRVTSASSCAKSSIAPCTTPAASGSPSVSSESSFFLLTSPLRSSTNGSSPALRNGLRQRSRISRNAPLLARSPSKPSSSFDSIL